MILIRIKIAGNMVYPWVIKEKVEGKGLQWNFLNSIQRKICVSAEKELWVIWMGFLIHLLLQPKPK